MKTINNYKIADERIILLEKEDLKEYPYILIFDKTNIEYIICKYETQEKGNFLLIDIESDYNYLTDGIMKFDIEIIGFFECIPYNGEYLESEMYRLEHEKEKYRLEYERMKLKFEIKSNKENLKLLKKNKKLINKIIKNLKPYAS